MTQHWFAVDYTIHHGNPSFPPERAKHILVRAEQNLTGNVYWGDGPAHFFFTKESNPIVVKNYGEATFDFGRYEAEMLYVQDYPPQKSEANEVSAGLLSPEGDWYPTAYGGHSGLAFDLFIWRYPKDADDHCDPETFLRENHWIFVWESFIQSDMNPKEVQLQRLRLIEQNDDLGHFKEALKDYLTIWRVDA